MRSGASRPRQPATVVATAYRSERSAHIDVRLVGGNQLRVNASGQVPLATDGPIDVHANGTIDAAIANPILEADGRRVKGQVTLDVAFSGTVSAPRLNGDLRLAQGDL